MYAHASLHINQSDRLEIVETWVKVGVGESEATIFVRDIETADRLAHIFGVLADTMRDAQGKLFREKEMS